MTTNDTGAADRFDGLRTALDRVREELDSLAANEAAADALPSAVTIPGMMVARIDGGGITTLTFLPAGGDPGYFGPLYHHYEGPEHDDDTLDAMLTQALAVGVSIGWEG
jgi:hypothetical protein